MLSTLQSNILDKEALKSKIGAGNLNIIGATGSGKSVILKYLIKKFKENDEQIIMIDPYVEECSNFIEKLGGKKYDLYKNQEVDFSNQLISFNINPYKNYDEVVESVIKELFENQIDSFVTSENKYKRRIIIIDEIEASGLTKSISLLHEKIIEKERKDISLILNFQSPNYHIPDKLKVSVLKDAEHTLFLHSCFSSIPLYEKFYKLPTEIINYLMSPKKYTGILLSEGVVSLVNTYISEK